MASPELDLLVETLKHPNHEKRVAAVSAIGDSMDRDYLDALVELFRFEKNKFVEATLVKALAKIGGNDVINVIAPCLKHIDARVRANTLEAFEICDSPKVFDLTIPLFYDPDPRVRANAAKLIWKNFNKKAIPKLKEMIQSRENSERLSAIYALGEIADPVCIKLLELLSPNADSKIQRKAREAKEAIEAKCARESLNPSTASQLSDDWEDGESSGTEPPAGGGKTSRQDPEVKASGDDSQAVEGRKPGGDGKATAQAGPTVPGKGAEGTGEMPHGSPRIPERDSKSEAPSDSGAQNSGIQNSRSSTPSEDGNESTDLVAEKPYSPSRAEEQGKSRPGKQQYKAKGNAEPANQGRKTAIQRGARPDDAPSGAPEHPLGKGPSLLHFGGTLAAAVIVLVLVNWLSLSGRGGDERREVVSSPPAASAPVSQATDKALQTIADRLGRLEQFASGMEARLSRLEEVVMILRSVMAKQERSSKELLTQAQDLLEASKRSREEAKALAELHSEEPVETKPEEPKGTPPVAVAPPVDSTVAPVDRPTGGNREPIFGGVDLKITENTVPSPENLEKARALVEQGLGAMDDNKNDLALELFSKALTLHPTNVKALYNSGTLAFYSGDRQGARVFFEKVLDVSAGHTDSMYLLSECLIDALEFDSAESLLKRYISLKPNDPAVPKRIGDLRMAKDDPAGAADYYSKALGMEPSSVELKGRLGLALQSSGNNEKAVPLLEEAVSTLGTPDISTALGLALLATGDSSRARKILEDCWSRYSNPQAGIHVAEMYAAENLYPKAKPIYEAILSKDPGNQRALIGSGKLKMNLKDYKGALADFEVLCATYPANHEFVLMISDVYEASGMYNEAIHEISKALKLPSAKNSEKELKDRMERLSKLDSSSPGTGQQGSAADRPRTRVTTSTPRPSSVTDARSSPGTRKKEER